MTPVTWNDNEPEFPNFLPPLEPKPTVFLTATQARERIEGVFKAAGVKIDVFTYADYGYPSYMEVTAIFPDGAEFSGDIEGLDTDGYSR